DFLSSIGIARSQQSARPCLFHRSGSTASALPRWAICHCYLLLPGDAYVSSHWARSRTGEAADLTYIRLRAPDVDSQAKGGRVTLARESKSTTPRCLGWAYLC